MAGLTLEQLQKMGSKPIPQTQGGGLTLTQVLAQQKTQNSQPEQGFLGTNPNDSTYGKIIDNSITRGIQSIFPGKQVGNAIGESVAAIGKTIQTGDMKNLAPQPGETTPLQVAGDLGQIGLTVAAPNIGTGATVGGRIAANAALGAGLGGTNAISEGKSLGDILKSTAMGGAVGGGVSAAGEGLSALAKNLPTWFAKSALPKAKDGTIDYALTNAPIGSTKTLLENSNKSAKSYGNQINSILTHPQYENEVGNAGSIVDSVSNAFPNSGMNNDKIIKIVKNVAKGNATIVDKVANGTATLAEQNTLRSELDSAIYPKFTDTPALTFNKKVGKSFTDLLRNNVQSTAPETAPIFKEYAKELDLRKVLNTINTKNNLKPTWQDALAAYGGFQVGGVKGAAEAFAAERLLGSSAVKLGAGKVIQKVGQVGVPIAQKAFQGLKSPAIKAITK